MDYIDLLWGGLSVVRLPVGARFSAPLQTGPGAYLASYTMGTGSFPRVEWSGRGVDHPPHLAPRLKKKYSYSCTPPMGPRGLFWSELYLATFTCM